MKLTYQVAIASLAQFLVLVILGVPNTIVSIISTCHSDGSNCVSNSIVSLIVFLLTAVWFGFMLLIAYNAQQRRSRLLALMLIGLEFITLVADGYINLRHDTNILSKATSLIDVLFSIWIIYLATRLILSGGGRVVKGSGRARKRKTR